MTQQEQIDRIERDRRDRESAALLFLLALMGRSRVNVNRAIRVGAPWRPMLTATLLGDERLDQRGGIYLLALLMADAYAAGLRRFGRLVGIRLEVAATREKLIERFTGRARETLERIAGAVQREIEKALAEAEPADSIVADVQAAGGAFRVTGMVEDASHGAEAEATTAITVAYAEGVWDAIGEPEVRKVMTGLRFVNPLDERTTDICRKRHGVTLPLDHPWFLAGNYPPLHWGCRSVVLPLTGNGVKFTENPPTYPPAEPGWGLWAGMLSATA